MKNVNDSWKKILLLLFPRESHLLWLHSIFLYYSKLRYSLPPFWSLCCVINGRYNCLLQNMLLQRDLFYRRIECFVCCVQNVYLSRKKTMDIYNYTFCKRTNLAIWNRWHNGNMLIIYLFMNYVLIVLRNLII